MSDEDRTLAGSIDHATSDMTGKQRERFVTLLGESLPTVLAAVREETFKGGASAQQESLQEAYNRDLEKIRQGDARGLSNLKKKYRRRGLQIW